MLQLSLLHLAGGLQREGDLAARRQGDEAVQSLPEAHSGGATLVQLLDVLIQLVAALGEFVGEGRPGFRVEFGFGVQGRGQLLEHVDLAGLVGVELQQEIAQTNLRKAAMHHLQRGALFRDKEHGFPLAERVGDEVGNGLALAGAGRTLEHKAMPFGGGKDRRQLGRVCAEGRVDLRGMTLRINFLGTVHGLRLGECRGAAIVAHEVLDQRAGAQVLGVVFEVPPHQEF